MSSVTEDALVTGFLLTLYVLPVVALFGLAAGIEEFIDWWRHRHEKD